MRLYRLRYQGEHGRNCSSLTPLLWVEWISAYAHSPDSPLPLLQECGGMQTHKLLWGFSDYRCAAVRGRQGGCGDGQRRSEASCWWSAVRFRRGGFRSIERGAYFMAWHPNVPYPTLFPGRRMPASTCPSPRWSAAGCAWATRSTTHQSAWTLTVAGGGGGASEDMPRHECLMRRGGGCIRRARG